MKPRLQNSLCLAARSSSLLGLCSITLCFLGAGHAMAQGTWDGGGADTSWSTGSNWVADAAPTGGALTFIGTTRPVTNNDLAAGTQFTSITFGNTTGGAFTLGGAAIKLSGDITGTTPTAGGTVNNVINFDIELNHATAGTLQKINLNRSGTNFHSFTLNGLISGTGGMEKNNNGNLTISRTDNTFTGAYRNNGFNDTSVTSIAASGTASSIGAGSSIILDSGNLVINGTSNGTINRSIESRVNGTNTARIDNNNPLAANAFNFTGTFSNTGSGGTPTFGVGGSNLGDNVFSGTLVNGTSNVLGFVKAGASTWTLSGNSTYTGPTSVDQGILKVATIADTGGSNAGLGTNIRLGLGNNTATLEYTGAGSTTARSVTIGYNNGTNAGSSAIINNTGSGALVFTNPNFNPTVVNTTTGITRTLTLTGANALANRVDGIIQDGNANTLTALTKSGAGRWVLGGANSYTGATAVSGGVLQLNNSSALGGANLNLNGGILGLGAADFTRALGTGAGQVQITSATASGFAAYNDNRAVNLGGASATVTWTSGGFFASGSNTLSLSAATATHTLDFQNPINLNAFSRTFDVANGAALVDAKLSGALTGATNSNIVKAGLGTLELSAANSYIGTTSVNAGTLLVTNTTGSGTSTGAVSVADSATLGGTGTIAPTEGSGISIASGGKLAPGASDSIGAIIVDLGSTTGKLTMSGGSIFDWQLSGSGGAADQMNFWNYNSGDLVLNTNAVNLRLTGAEAAGTYTTTLFRFFSDGGTTAAASGLTSGLSIGSLVGSFSGTPTFDYGTAGEIRLTYSVVPEPSSALVGLLVGAGLLRRRRA